MRQFTHKLPFLGLFFATLAPEAFSAQHDWQHEIEASARKRTAECGVVYVDGQDPRLDYLIRQRHVNEVLAFETSPASLRPILLLDTDLRGRDIRIQYQRLNGSNFFVIRRDPRNNDVAIDTVIGRVAWTNTIATPQGRVVQHRVRNQLVTEDAFASFVRQELIPEFVRVVCSVR